MAGGPGTLVVGVKEDDVGAGVFLGNSVRGLGLARATLAEKADQKRGDDATREKG